MTGEFSTHPRIRERRAEVQDQSIRSRRRKVIAVGVAVLLVFLAIAATQSPLLDVDEVRIVGAERISPDELRRVAEVELGRPVLGLDTGAIEDRLGALPSIESVQASAGWGGVVTIEIAERLAVARIETANGTVVVASDGIALEVLDRTVPGEGGPTEDGLLEQNGEPTTEVLGTGDDLAESGDDPAASSDLDDSGVDPTAIRAPLPPEIESLPEIAGAIFTIAAGERIPTVLDDAVAVAEDLPDDIASVTERIEITVDSLVLRAVGSGTFALGDARDLDLKFAAIRAFLAQADLSCLETLDVRAPSVPVIRRNC